METLLVFLFLFFSLFLFIIAKLFNFKILLGLPFIILVLLGLEVSLNGYDVQTSFNTYQFNHTYFSDSGTNEITGMNVTKTPSYIRTVDTMSQTFGMALIALGLIAGFAAAFG